MRKSYYAIVEENHHRINTILPYVTGFSALFLLTQILFAVPQLHQLMTTLLVILNMLAFVVFRATGPHASVTRGYAILLLMWGTANIFVMPENVTAHVAMTSLYYCLSFILVYRGWEAAFLFAPFTAVLLLGLRLIPNEFFLFHAVTYLSTMVIATAFTHMNQHLWRDTYKQKNRLLSRALNFKQQAQATQDEKDLLNEQLESTLKFGRYIFDHHFEDADAFLRHMLKEAMGLCPQADSGAVYLIENDYVRFVDAIGHDLEKLNQMAIHRDLFRMDTEQVMVVYDITERFSRLSEDRQLINRFIAATTPIRETITFQIELEDERAIGLSLDISNDSKLHFDSGHIRTMEAFQSIVRFYFINERFIALQTHFKSDLIRSLATFLELHDQYTRGHSTTVADYSRQIAIQIGLESRKVSEIYWAGIMHDIGKLLIPNKVLNKVDPLTPEERLLIRKHPQIASRALNDNPEFHQIARIIRAHHERYDGTGYPDGLKGEAIPLEARIIAIADSYEAMIANRPYKKRKSHEEAMEELRVCSGSQFDPTIVHEFISLLAQESPPSLAS